jgi:hypothetical protein
MAFKFIYSISSAKQNGAYSGRSRPPIPDDPGHPLKGNLVGPEKVINAQALTAMTPWTLVCATMSLTLLFEKTEARDKYGVKRQLPT